MQVGLRTVQFIEHLGLVDIQRVDDAFLCKCGQGAIQRRRISTDLFGLAFQLGYGQWDRGKRQCFQ